MHIVSPQFGQIDIDENTVITFPECLPGFDGCSRFKLLHEDVVHPKVMWLQSLDEPELVLSVVDANLLGVHYQLSLSDEESALIEYDHPEDVVLLLTLVREADQGVRANMRSPIVLNTASRKAIQKGGLRAEIVFTNQ